MPPAGRSTPASWSGTGGPFAARGIGSRNTRPAAGMTGDRSRPTSSHSIDAAQEGFYRACAATRDLRKAGFPEVRFPYHPQTFRTTIWKSTGIRRRGDVTACSPMVGAIPRSRSPSPPNSATSCGSWKSGWSTTSCRGSITGTSSSRTAWLPSPRPDRTSSSVDLGEIHPAVVGDEQEAIIITCRERRAASQGHARRLANIAHALSRKMKGSRRHRRLVQARSRMKAKQARVMRDMEHKISRAIVDDGGRAEGRERS